eukprot:776142-Rhodomonas_salina.1
MGFVRNDTVEICSVQSASKPSCCVPGNPGTRVLTAQQTIVDRLCGGTHSIAHQLPQVLGSQRSGTKVSPPCVTSRPQKSPCCAAVERNHKSVPRPTQKYRRLCFEILSHVNLCRSSKLAGRNSYPGTRVPGVGIPRNSSCVDKNGCKKQKTNFRHFKV